MTKRVDMPRSGRRLELLHVSWDSWSNGVVVIASASEQLSNQARRLAWATIGWNVLEAVVAIGAGAVANSVALVGFGLDSTVEVLSAFVIVWQQVNVVFSVGP